MSLQTRDADENLKTAPVYVVWDSEMMIDAPVQDVWRHVINYPSWQNYSIVQHVSGRPGQEGEVVLLKKEEAGLSFPPYYARTIKLERERRAIWKTYRDTPDYFGIVDFMLSAAGNQTRFHNHALYEHIVSYRDEAELDAFRRQRYEIVEASVAAILPKLKKLAERGRL